MPLHIPEGLIRAISDRKCIVFVGAGLSRSARLPGWAELLKHMLDAVESENGSIAARSRLDNLIRDGKLLDAAEKIKGYFLPNEYMEFMNDVFSRSKVEVTPTYQLLPLIGFKAALTTNYDTLLERAWRQQDEHCPVYTYADAPELRLALYTGEPYILKLHGTIERIRTVVLTRSDYDKMLSNETYLHCLRTIFSTQTVFFLGFSLTDPDLSYVLHDLQSIFVGYPGIHYALMPEIGTVARKKDFETLGIRLIEYTPSSPNHPEVHQYLVDLKSSLTGIS